jgi:hypothetical protein
LDVPYSDVARVGFEKGHPRVVRGDACVSPVGGLTGENFGDTVSREHEFLITGLERDIDGEVNTEDKPRQYLFAMHMPE